MLALQKKNNKTSQKNEKGLKAASRNKKTDPTAFLFRRLCVFRLRLLASNRVQKKKKKNLLSRKKKKNRKSLLDERDSHPHVLALTFRWLWILPT